MPVSYTHLDVYKRQLPGKVPYLGGIPWPLEAAVIQSFIQKAEAIFFKMQRLDPVTASPTKKEQGIAVGLHFIGIPDDGHQSINTFSHVGVAALSYC